MHSIIAGMHCRHNTHTPPSCLEGVKADGGHDWELRQRDRRSHQYGMQKHTQRQTLTRGHAGEIGIAARAVIACAGSCSVGHRNMRHARQS